jgi:tetratricopeptide (TPR) repeat protein
MSIENSDENEFSDRPHESNEIDELDLDPEDEWLDLDTSESEDDISLVSNLFQQISQETPASPNLTETPIEKNEVKSTKPQQANSIGIGLAIALGITSVLGLIWTRFLPQTTPVTTVPSASSVSDTSKAENLNGVDTPKLSAIASQKFAKGDLNGATAAVEILLDRNALVEAKQVLSAISSGQMDTAEISFLRGRLIWQSLDDKSNTTQIQQVQQLWQNAVKKQPDSALYRNALGFAYYAQNKLNEAINVWFEAIALGEQSQLQLLTEPAKKQVLNNYAGIALALWRVSQTQPPAKKQELLQQSINLGRKVIIEAPTDFQPENLSQDWMWSKTAIQDWRSFLQEKPAKTARLE